MPEKTPTLEEIVRMRVVLTVPGMDTVVARRELVYEETSDGPLLLDVYAPPGPARPRPVVILVHGGPVPRLGARTMGVFVSYGELLAASGFAAVTFDHRFLDPERLADAAGDVAALLAHVRAEAPSLGVDPDRVALWAFSGGGPLLAEPLRQRPAWLRAVVAYYAALDLPQRPEFSARVALGEDARAVPPVLVARAGRDSAPLNQAIDRFVEAALKSGATLDLLSHPDGRHGFDILDDDARSRGVIRRTLEFLREQLAS